MTSWSKDFLLEFIELFRSEECLWKLTSKDYHNKQKRDASYKILIDKVKEIDPLANKQLVTKKINTLRSSFRKELRKSQKYCVSGMSSDDVYHPKLWYYDQLMFLCDQEAVMESKSSLAADCEHEERWSLMGMMGTSLGSAPAIALFGCLLTISASIAETGNSDIWPLERPDGMPAIQSLEVMCGKDHMDVHLSFTQPFEGIVSSKGQYGDPRCVYVPPSTGKTFFSFRIAYARCGTKPDLHGQFYENTVVVQYDKDLLEVWDEAKRLRCEWYNDYEKTASKPPMVIADLDVIQLDFRGDNVDCWMEIQHGKGPWAPPVSGIVPLGSTLTLVVAINDYRGEFDMRVKSCAASDGGGHIIQLSDEHGCVLRPKMISRFLKARIADERASVITYAFFHAFKFPDALSVHIKCKVEICRHGCLDHCQVGDEAAYGEGIPQDSYRPLERRDPAQSKPQFPPEKPETHDTFGDLIYDDITNIGELNLEKSKGPNPPTVNLNQPHAQQQISPKNPAPIQELLDDIPRPFQEPPLRPNGPQERFPHGPRNLGTDSEPIVGTVSHRRRRSVVVSDRKVRSADVGVSGLYEVISEADLAFTPDSRAEAVTVFQGRIREEVVYGICLPVPGFSALFCLVAVSAVVSALVAGSLLYRYQLQRETQRLQQAAAARQSGVALHTITSWMALRLLRARGTPPSHSTPQPPQ